MSVCWYQCLNKNCVNCQEKKEFSVVVESKTGVVRCWKCQSSNVRLLRTEFKGKQRKPPETPAQILEQKMEIPPGMEDL